VSAIGAGLVNQAFGWNARKKHRGEAALTSQALNLLLFMSNTALDTDAQPRYFASREASALALGRIVPDRVAPDDPNHGAIEAEREAAFQRVKLATQALVAAGAISSIKRGREGQRAEYALSFATVENASARGTENVPLTGTENVPLSGSKSVRQPGRKPYPQGELRNHKEKRRGQTPAERVPHFGPVDNEKETEIAS
jgi:hypothetical protein